MFEEYIEWRAKNPSDDLMTQLLESEFNDETGTLRRLTRQEVLTYVDILAAAGNETTTRLIGWTGKAARASIPTSVARSHRTAPWSPDASRRSCATSHPHPVQARYVVRDVEHYGQTVPEGSSMVLLNGSANRDERHFERC